MRDEPISTVERNFILEALKAGIRVDGRKIEEARHVSFDFGTRYGTVIARLGKTKVLATATAQVVEPTADRPTEGFLTFSVDFSPMACELFALEYGPGGRSSITCEEATEVVRFLQLMVRDSNAVDTETLCIMAGSQVWAIRVDIQVVDNAGNLLDACCLAAVAVLLHMRRPDVTVIGKEVIIHTIEDREPVPLTVHHLPICVSFGIFFEGDLVAIDPNLQEEVALEGYLSIAVNAHKEVCAFHKAGGAPIETSVISECASLAYWRATEVTMQLEQSLKETYYRNPSVTINPLLIAQRTDTETLENQLNSINAAWDQLLLQDGTEENQDQTTDSTDVISLQKIVNMNDTTTTSNNNSSGNEDLKEDYLDSFSSDSDMEDSPAVIARPRGGKRR
eukprot:jgi/Galph1/696/GphlegSOOS_G5521.1